MVLELYSVLRAEPEGVTLRSLVATLHDRDKELSETRHVCRGHHARSTVAEVQVPLGLLKKYEGRAWRLDGKTFQFIVVDTTEPRVIIKEE
jgi:hypothetical protein